MIYVEVYVPTSKVMEAFNHCVNELGEQVQNHFMIWECKSADTGAVFFLYREEDAVLFVLKYG